LSPRHTLNRGFTVFAKHRRTNNKNIITTTDLIEFDKIYAALVSFGVPNKLMKLVKMTLNKSQAKVVVGNSLSDP
jgi:hypothetical protein